MTLATRRATAALAAVLAMAGAAAGCGDDSDSGNDDNSTAAVGVEDGEPTEAAGPADTNSDDAVDVDGALLQLTDMPDGWAQLPEAEDTGEPPLCGVDSDAQASYALDRNTGPIVMHEVTAAGGDPAAHFAEAAGLLDGCEASYGGFGYQFTDLNVPEVGEESRGFRATVTDEASGQVFTMDGMVYRAGPVVGLVAVLDPTGAGGDLLVTVAGQAVDRAAAI